MTVAYEWADKLVLHYTRLERFDGDKYSSLLGLELWRMWSVVNMAQVYQTVKFCRMTVTYEWADNLVLPYTNLETLARDKYSSLLDLTLSYKKVSVVNTALVSKLPNSVEWQRFIRSPELRSTKAVLISAFLMNVVAPFLF